MKKIFFRRFLYTLVLAALVSLFLYTSCKKEDTECEAVITARFLSDTTVVVPFASIIIDKHDVYVDGMTDSKGQFRHTFDLEAILDVTASVDTSSYDTLVYYFEGNTVIRLRPGETIYRTVFLSP
jgi:hypothetical protein